jgi:hypothetical protein
MLNISRQATKTVFCILGFLHAAAGLGDELTLSVNDKENINIVPQNGRALATNQNHTVRYNVSNALARHIINAESLQALSRQRDGKDAQFIILSHELSRPGALGHGYCGGGYEDYLLLIELSGHKIVQLDELLLQSCLKSIDLGTDDSAKALIPLGAGSYSFQWIGDDSRRILSVMNNRFYTVLAPPAKN